MKNLTIMLEKIDPEVFTPEIQAELKSIVEKKIDDAQEESVIKIAALEEKTNELQRTIEEKDAEIARIDEEHAAKFNEAVEKLDTDHAEKLQKYADSVDADHTAKLENVIETIDADHTAKLENVIETIDADHTAKLEKLVEAIDEDHTTKLEKVVESIDADHTAKLEKLVEAIDEDHAMKLEKVVESVKSELPEIDSVVNTVSQFLEEKISEAIPTDRMVNEERAARMEQCITEMKRVLQVSETEIEAASSEDVADAMERLKELEAENAQLNEQINKREAEILLERKTQDMPDTEAAFIRTYFESAKTPDEISEKLDEARKAFENRQAELLTELTEKSSAKSVAIDLPVLKSISPAENDAIMDQYVNRIEKSIH